MMRNEMLPVKIILTSLLCVASIPNCSTDVGMHRRLLQQAIEQYYDWVKLAAPETAMYLSSDIRDYKFDEYTQEQFKKDRDSNQDMIHSLERIDPNQLSGTDLDNYDVLKYQLNQMIQGYKWRNYGALNPINFLEGPHMSSPPFHISYYSLLDLQILTSNIIKYPKQIDQVIKLMQQAIKLNRTNHKVSMRGILEQISSYIRPFNDSFWSAPYRQILPRLDISTYSRNKIIKEAIDAVEKRINPALEKLKTFISKVYMRHTRRHIGVWSLKDGAEYYNECLKFYLSVNMTAEQVRDIGYKEVNRIKQLMIQIMRENGFEGSLPKFFNYLRIHKRKQYYDRSPKQLLREYKNVVNRIEPHLNKVIRHVPRLNISLVQVSNDGPAGSSGGDKFYVNVKESETRPVFTMMSLTLHEAKPGHALEWKWKYFANLSLPNLRRIGGTKYNAGPFNLPWYAVYSEGWALYAEYLGEVMDIFNKSSLELFGRYSWEMLRAVRLVVDTSIHAFRMTRTEAIEYMAGHTAVPRGQIEREVDRYITWPGQACAYKIGELHFKKWKTEAETKLGDNFDIRDYNEALLNAARAPLSVVRRSVDDYINKHITYRSTAYNQALYVHVHNVTIIFMCVLVTVLCNII